MDKKYFKYSQKELDYLSDKDPKLKALIEKTGFIQREINADLFQAIIRSIVGQQISTIVQKSIMKKITANFPNFTASSIYNTTNEELRNLGLSYRKISYIKDFAEKIINKEIDLQTLKNSNDNEVIKTLIKVKGIGVWTAEMTLLFSLERKDVFSFGDLAIKRGLKLLYGYEEITKEIFEKHRKIYSPYGSIASLYLWHLSTSKKQ